MAKSVQKLLQEEQVQILDWLAQSPDLKNLQKFWYEFLLEKCKKYIGSMHQRCVEVIKKKGYHSGYWYYCFFNKIIKIFKCI